MAELKANVSINSPERLQETEKNENDSDGPEQSDSNENQTESTEIPSELTENPTDTVSLEDENTTPTGNSIHDSYDDWDDVFYKEEDFSECVDEDEILVECEDDRAESSKKEKNQNSNIQEAAPQAPQDIAQSSLVPSCDDPATFRKKLLESISEEPELKMFPPKKGSKFKRSKDTKKLGKGQPKSIHSQQISLGSKNIAQRPVSGTSKCLPQMKGLAKMIPMFIHERLLRPETTSGAANRITAFPSVPLTERDKPHTMKIRNWLKKQRPQTETERPPPVPPRISGASNLSMFQTEEKTAPVRSAAGKSKKIKKTLAVQPQKEDLVSAISKDETTAQPESVTETSKQPEKPALTSPPKKNTKFTAPALEENETAPVESTVEVAENLEKLSLVPPQNEDIKPVPSVPTEENIAQLELANDTDIPAVSVNQKEDSQQQPTLLRAESPQQLNEILKNHNPLELLVTAVESLTIEQTAASELIPNVSEEAEQIPSVLPIPDDDTNSSSVQEDEKTAQEMQSKESEGFEKTPPVSPRTKFFATDSLTGLKHETVQVNKNLAQLGGVARKLRMNKETRSNEQNKSQSESAEEAAPVPQKRKFPKPILPTLLEGNGSEGDAIEEALKQIGYNPPPLPVPSVPIPQHAGPDAIQDESWKLTCFPSVPITARDAPHNTYVYWPKKKTEKVAQKLAKKKKRLPPALLKMKHDTGTSEVATEKAAEQVEPLSDLSEKSAPVPSVPENSSAISENTAPTSPILSKSTSKTAKPRLIPQKRKNVEPNYTFPPAADAWQDFNIPELELREDLSTLFEFQENNTIEQSDMASTIRSTSDFVVIDGVRISRKTPPAQFNPYKLSSLFTEDPFTDQTHDDYLEGLTKRKIKVFRACRDNIPKDDYICDLIGVRVYQWTSCPNDQQPCKMFCQRCNFCCHQFFCTCMPYKFRALTWCVHIHAAIPRAKDERESVVFVMDTGRMNQPSMAHLRALCYDFDNVSVADDFYLVKEFSPLRTKITRGNRSQRCSDCYPKQSCSTCDICVHVFKCICDVFRQGELCEHCHVVAMYQKEYQDMLPKSRTSDQTSDSSRIPKQASNFGETAAQASSSGRTSAQASSSGKTSAQVSNSGRTSSMPLDSEAGDEL